VPQLRFSDESDTIREEAQAFRRLSPTERMLAILDLVASGERMMRDSPCRDAANRLRAEHEEQWRRAYRELFTRHGL
jgi:hypothetical protein